jgi:serine/threonine protein kinase
MNTTTCPSPELLADYALGRVSIEQLEQVANHVDGCTDCQGRLEDLEGVNDSFVSKLRQPLPADLSSPDQELEALIAQAEAMQLDAEAERSGVGPSATAETSRPGSGLSITLGQYELLARLGHGGMGTVYKARHLRLKRFVAVKVISQQRLPDPQAVARFHREMEAVGRLTHPNIVQATDAGEAGGQHFLAMEFVEGPNLAQLVRSGGSLSVPDACEIVRQAAAGLEHAHEHGLVHRDVKPSNLMLANDGTVKVLDLGLARLLDSPGDEAEATGSEQILGSPDFMAPEQAQDSRQVDARTDLYSLGCTLYFLLTGRPPFAEPDYDTRLKKVMAHVREQPTPIQSVRPDLQSSLSDLLARLLAKAPCDRPRSAADVADMLVPLAVGSDLPSLVRARPTPQAAENSLSVHTFGTALSQRLSPPTVRTAWLRRRAWPVLGVTCIMLAVLIWTCWPHHPNSNTVPPAANHEQGPAASTIAPAKGRLFFKGAPEGVVLRISGGQNGPILVDMDKQRSIWLAPGDYRIEIERETTPHGVMQKQVTLEEGEQATVVVHPSHAADFNRMAESWKKTNDDLKNLQQRTEAIQREQAEKNRR